MLFNSYEYFSIFLPITVIVYFLLNRRRYTKAATAWLVLASLVFYSWWNVKYLALILASILVNFGVGSALGKSGKERHSDTLRRAVLIFGILFNVLLLGYYKYADFFIANINGADRPGPRAPEDRAAAGHQLLHLHPDRLPRGHVQGQGAGNTIS